MKKNRSFSNEEIEENKNKLNKEVEKILKMYFEENKSSLKVKESIKKVIKDYTNILALQSERNREVFLNKDIYEIIDTVVKVK